MIGWLVFRQNGSFGWIVIWVGWVGNCDVFPLLGDRCHEEIQGKNSKKHSLGHMGLCSTGIWVIMTETIWTAYKLT